jgi:hypothetical protein
VYTLVDTQKVRMRLSLRPWEDAAILTKFYACFSEDTPLPLVNLDPLGWCRTSTHRSQLSVIGSESCILGKIFIEDIDGDGTPTANWCFGGWGKFY